MAGINILGQAIKCLILDSWSITTIIFIQLLLIGRLIIKLINISFYLQSRIGSGFRSLLYTLYKALAYQQVLVGGGQASYRSFLRLRNPRLARYIESSRRDDSTLQSPHYYIPIFPYNSRYSNQRYTFVLYYIYLSNSTLIRVVLGFFLSQGSQLLVDCIHV